MKKLLTIFLLLTCGLCFGQNLVSNPSFEENTGCPYASNQASFCKDWSSFGNSPDYFHNCATTSGFSPPTTIWGYQMPHSGGAFVSLVTYFYSPYYREIIGNSLTTPLIIGQKYFLSFFINCAYVPLTSGIASNKLGLRFSTGPFSEINVAPINNFAHLYSDSVVSDTLLWFKISGSFTADSAYSYLAIGNFFQDSFTDTSHFGPEPRYYAMYYVDDVCVSTDSLNCNLPLGIRQTNQNDDVSLFPNPFSTQLTFSLADNEPITLSLYNFLGQQILQQTFTNSTTINTEQLTNGIYFYELRSNKGILKTGKVVKQ